ncbi:hypothetical protein DCAR_0311077 [Daucus carota subsp. sativus]|uniref:Serine hydrolase domain-containing protein n=1 Tax=Daucus carota subsp. sativus TaxID=79200 RepID=A0AAF0WKZ8_DAUCS|nr:hypothetical protein DCAR_0311077 [Daucus carota subsp. sativus]
MKLTSEMKKSKILCLHGGRSSGVLLKEELEIWPSSVLERMDLVCIDAPFAAYDVDFRAFTWYDDQVCHPTTSNQLRLNIMFNESVAYIEETMVKLGPFDGVLGMSMGALIAAALPGMQAQVNYFSLSTFLAEHVIKIYIASYLKCVVVICGGKFASVEIATPKLAENAFSSLIQTPSLHIFGENDFAKLGAIELLESFVDPFVILHPGGHEVPELDEKGLKVMNSFLDKIQASFPSPRVRSLM